MTATDYYYYEVQGLQVAGATFPGFLLHDQCSVLGANTCVALTIATAFAAQRMAMTSGAVNGTGAFIGELRGSESHTRSIITLIKDVD